MQSNSGTLSSSKLMSETSEDAVAVRHPRSVFLSPTKVARLSFSSPSELTLVPGRLHSGAAPPCLLPLGQPLADTTNRAAVPAAAPMNSCTPAPQSLEGELSSLSESMSTCRLSEIPAQSSASTTVTERQPQKPLAICTGFHAPEKPAGSELASASSGDVSPQLVDVLMSANAPAPASSQLTAVLTGGRESALQETDDQRAMSLSSEEEEWELIEGEEEHAANGTAAGSLGSFKDGLLKRLTGRLSP